MPPILPLVAAPESEILDIPEAASVNRLPVCLSPLVVAEDESDDDVTELSAPVTLDIRFWPNMELFLMVGLSELSVPSPLRERGTNIFLGLLELLMLLLLLLLVRESDDE